jgi:hypothetical protein
LAGSWAVRETFVAVVTANIPMVFPLFKTWLGPVFGSLMSTKRSTEKLSDQKRSFRTWGGGSHQSWRGRGPPTANPITNVTINESEERIVDDIKMQDLNHERSSTSDKDIRKQIEIAVVREALGDRSTHVNNNRIFPTDEENSPHGNFAFAKGPKRSSYN